MSEENNVEEIDEKEASLEELGLTGKEVEEFMVNAAKERAEDPTEMAAGAYAMYGPYLKMAIPKLSTRSLRRILKYLVFYPLEQDSVQAANETEKSVMQLANLLIEAKFVMQMDAYRAGLEQIVTAAETPLTAEQEEEIKKQLENNNG